jgi:hypothetical protein
MEDVVFIGSPRAFASGRKRQCALDHVHVLASNDMSHFMSCDEPLCLEMNTAGRE